MTLLALEVKVYELTFPFVPFSVIKEDVTGAPTVTLGAVN
jgi:hypothetical protein